MTASNGDEDVDPQIEHAFKTIRRLLDVPEPCFRPPVYSPSPTIDGAVIITQASMTAHPALSLLSPEAQSPLLSIAPPLPPVTHEPPRVMCRCTDSLMSRMTSATSSADEMTQCFTTGAPPAETPSGDTTTIGAHSSDRSTPSGDGVRPAAPPKADLDDQAQPHQETSNPGDDTDFDLSDEQAASLIRPILRQWMDHNMKHAFFMALHAEATTGEARNKNAA